jgi:hypothetical protein
MSRENLRSIIKHKRNYEDKLVVIFKKYYINFIKDKYIKSLREFQENLLKIPKWSGERISNEFQYFLKYVKKTFNLNENELSKILNIIFKLYINISIEINIPKIEVFWYKCLKRIAKFFYENPKLIKYEAESTHVKENIGIIIKNTIQRFVPFKNIMNSVLTSYDNATDDKYDFENNDYSKEFSDLLNILNIESQKNYNPIIDGEKNLRPCKSQNSLTHISSDKFENEYYHSEPEPDHELTLKNIIDNDTSNYEKQIKIPRIKKF